MRRQLHVLLSFLDYLKIILIHISIGQNALIHQTCDQVCLLFYFPF